jgi:hypothetical protein
MRAVCLLISSPCSDLPLTQAVCRPMYKIYNELLRNFLKFLNKELEGQIVTTETMGKALKLAKKELGDQYTTALLVLVSAIIKLRTVSKLPANRTVYRGFAGANIPEVFMLGDERGKKKPVSSIKLYLSNSKIVPPCSPSPLPTSHTAADPHGGMLQATEEEWSLGSYRRRPARRNQSGTLT